MLSLGLICIDNSVSPSTLGRGGEGLICIIYIVTPTTLNRCGGWGGGGSFASSPSTLGGGGEGVHFSLSIVCLGAHLHRALLYPR